MNPEAIGVLEEAGLKFVGKDETGKRMEVGFLSIRIKLCVCSAIFEIH